jgi:hypothetical protein
LTSGCSEPVERTASPGELSRKKREPDEDDEQARARQDQHQDADQHQGDARYRHAGSPDQAS